MNEADTARHQVTIGNLPTDSNQEGDPGLNLMPIRKPLNTYVRDDQRKLLIFTHAQANAFIDDCAIALGSMEGIAQQVGGIKNVVKQSYLSKVHIARQVKSEKIIVQRTRNQLDKFDLVIRSDVFFIYLPRRNTSLRHQWGHVDPSRSGACGGQSR
jgi:hypothetical protein